MAPKLLGSQARPLFDLPLLEDLAGAQRLEPVDTVRLGDDLRLCFRPRVKI